MQVGKSRKELNTPVRSPAWRLGRCCVPRVVARRAAHAVRGPIRQPRPAWPTTPHSRAASALWPAFSTLRCIGATTRQKQKSSTAFSAGTNRQCAPSATVKKRGLLFKAFLCRRWRRTPISWPCLSSVEFVFQSQSPCLGLDGSVAGSSALSSPCRTPVGRMRSLLAPALHFAHFSA